MIRLILGLVRPQDGGVSLCAADGTAIEMNAETRHLFAYVPQGNTIISGTIAENMRMVKEDATDEEIIEALKISCAWDFVSKMPDTINSNLGERGRGLSEGQAQRIAIARAVLRDAPVLLLDEPPRAGCDDRAYGASEYCKAAPEQNLYRNYHRQRAESLSKNL